MAILVDRGEQDQGPKAPAQTLTAIPALPSSKYTPRFQDPWANLGYELTGFVGRRLFGSGEDEAPDAQAAVQLDQVFDRIRFTGDGFAMDMGDGTMAPMDASDVNAFSGLLSRRQDAMKKDGSPGKGTESQQAAMQLGNALLSQADLPDDVRAAYEEAAQYLTPAQFQSHLAKTLTMLEESGGVASPNLVKQLEEDTYTSRSDWLDWEMKQLQTEFEEIDAREIELSDLLRASAESGTTAEHASQIKRERLRLQNRRRMANVQRIALHEMRAAQRPPGAPMTVEEADAAAPEWGIGQRIKEIVIAEYQVDGIELPNAATGQGMEDFIERMNDTAVRLGWAGGLMRQRTPGEQMAEQAQQAQQQQQQ